MPSQPALDLFSAKERHTTLSKEIAAADQDYHQKDSPILSDSDYDAKANEADSLRDRFPELPDRGVGYSPDPTMTRVAHSTPMMSLANVKSNDDLPNLFKLVCATFPGKPVEFCSELKIDGLSLALRYRGRIFQQAITRGDHVEGEDVTAAARNIVGLPLQLPPGAPADIEVRGEAYMTNADFDAANETRTHQGAELYKTARNAAAGAIRKGSSTDARKVRFQAYAAPGDFVADTQEELLTILESWGFEIPYHRGHLKSVEDMQAAHRLIGENRSALPFEIDGVVHKLSSFAQRESITGTGRTPGWAIAHKFPAAQATTILREIKVQVGRTGVMTPVAELDPVKIGGVIVSRATLHNADQVAEHDLRPGDTVLIERAGDVIPKILRRVADERAARGQIWAMPSHCPSCGAKSARDPEAAATRCTNAMSCSASAIARFEHLARRDVLDIDGLGGSAITDLTVIGLLRTPADIFRLKHHRKDIAYQPGWGEKSADGLLAAIEKARTIPLSRFITSLGIREIGRTAGRLIASTFMTTEATIAAMQGAADKNVSDIAALEAIPGIGPIMVQEIALWFREPQNVEAMNDLLREVTIAPLERVVQTGAQPLAGKTVVFTGTLESGSRPAAEAKAQALGAKTSGSISAKTHILVYGTDAGGKLEKARTVQAAGSPIEILAENEWAAKYLS
jgi:DNA ligase (NAD+)